MYCALKYEMFNRKRNKNGSQKVPYYTLLLYRAILRKFENTGKSLFRYSYFCLVV